MADLREAPPPGDCTAIAHLAVLLALLVSHWNQPLSSSLLFGLTLSFSPAVRCLFSSPSLLSIKPQCLASEPSGLPLQQHRMPPLLPNSPIHPTSNLLFSHTLPVPPPLLTFIRLPLVKRKSQSADWRSKTAETTFLHSTQPLLSPTHPAFSCEIQRGWQRANFCHYYHTNLMPLICNEWNSLSWWRGSAGAAEEERGRETGKRWEWRGLAAVVEVVVVVVGKGGLINNSICRPAWGSISSVSDCQCVWGGRGSSRSPQTVLPSSQQHAASINGHNLISHYHHQWLLACRARRNSIRQTGLCGVDVRHLSSRSCERLVFLCCILDVKTAMQRFVFHHFDAF